MARSFDRDPEPVTEVLKDKPAKLKKPANGAGPVEGDDVEARADEAMMGGDVDPDAKADIEPEEQVAERKEVKDLLEQGKQKGFLTYDEVNDALPADVAPTSSTT